MSAALTSHDAFVEHSETSSRSPSMRVRVIAIGGPHLWGCAPHGPEPSAVHEGRCAPRSSRTSEAFPLARREGSPVRRNNAPIPRQHHRATV